MEFLNVIFPWDMAKNFWDFVSVFRAGNGFVHLFLGAPTYPKNIGKDDAPSDLEE